MVGRAEPGEANDLPHWSQAFEDADFLYPKSWGPIMVTEGETPVEAMAAQNQAWRVTQSMMDLAARRRSWHADPVLAVPLRL